MAYSLFLIPWHIGSGADMTLSAVAACRRLRFFLAEDAAEARRQFQAVLGLDPRDKEFETIPLLRDDAFLARLLDVLSRQDAGMVASGGAPCFVDPGAWVVGALRERGVAVRALAGPSCLATVLSLSGLDFSLGNFSFGFFYYADGSRARFSAAASRSWEPLVVFLDKGSFSECLEAVAGLDGRRRVSAFFDLTKGPRERFPLADRVMSMTSREWLTQASGVDWEKVSDVALVLHPVERPR